MNAFLTSNEWQWRLARTIAQGVLGVFVANIDVLVGAVVFRPVGPGDRRGALHGGAVARDGRDRQALARGDRRSLNAYGQSAWASPGCGALFLRGNKYDYQQG